MTIYGYVSPSLRRGWFKVRASPDEIAKWKDAAKRQHKRTTREPYVWPPLNISEWARQALNKAAAAVPADPTPAPNGKPKKRAKGRAAA